MTLKKLNAKVILIACGILILICFIVFVVRPSVKNANDITTAKSEFEKSEEYLQIKNAFEKQEGIKDLTFKVQYETTYSNGDSQIEATPIIESEELKKYATATLASPEAVELSQKLIPINETWKNISSNEKTFKYNNIEIVLKFSEYQGLHSDLVVLVKNSTDKVQISSIDNTISYNDRIIFKEVKAIENYTPPSQDNISTDSESINKESSSNYTYNPSRHSDIDAWSCAQNIVESYLKSPSTADFCSYTEATVKDLGNGEYMVTGWVDSENDFGATVRSNFVVTYTATAKGYKNGSAVFD